MKKIGILTGGGDVQPLNAVISNVVKQCNRHNINIIGYIEGWRGILEEKYIELNNLEINPNIGGTFLKSSRINLSKMDNSEKQVLKKLDKLDVDGLIVIGGEDTLSNSLFLKNFPQVLISKTIDNDVGIINNGNIFNYFTLGHPTASEKISSFVSLKNGLRTTAYSHERIIIVESMGMHAGWLAMSSSLGEPDFIIIPEFPLNYENFIEQVKERFIKNRNVIVVVSEGARWESGNYIAADNSEVDEFGHPRFLGAANVLKNKLKNDLKKYFDTRNVNSVNPSYLYRSGGPNTLDLEAAALLGKKSIEILLAKRNIPIFLSLNLSNKLEVEEYDFTQLNNIEEFHRFIPKEFYDVEHFEATDDYINYISKINRFKEIRHSNYIF